MDFGYHLTFRRACAVINTSPVTSPASPVPYSVSCLTFQSLNPTLQTHPRHRTPSPEKYICVTALDSSHSLSGGVIGLLQVYIQVGILKFKTVGDVMPSACSSFHCGTQKVGSVIPETLTLEGQLRRCFLFLVSHIILI